MSKSRKKYNPRKVRRGWAGNSEAFAKRFTLASSERLSEEQITIITMSLQAQLAVMRQSWDSMAYNLVAHYYRMARVIGNEMQIPLLAKACDDAVTVLNELYHEPGNPVLTGQQNAVLAFMVDSLIALLPDIPLPLWQNADEASTEAVKQRTTEAYLELPQWARDAAIDVMSGQTVKALAARLGRSEKEISDQVRMAGAMLFTLKGDISIPFPANVTQLRKIGPQLLPIAAQYETTIRQLSAA